MVHQYQLNGYNIVLDSCSGSVHVVDDVAYDVIAMYKEHSADEIVAAMLAKYADRPDAVSYTHLDVYKRQVQMMYETILSPIHYGGMQLKNRIIFAPTTFGLSDEEYLAKIRACLLYTSRCV